MPNLKTEMQRHIWGLIQDMDEIHWTGLVELGITVTTAKNTLRDWVWSGDLVPLPKRGDNYVRYRLANAKPQPAKPHEFDNTVEGHLWRSMRGLRTFSARDLAAHCGIDVTLAAAKKYCAALVRSKHIITVQTAIPGKRDAVFKLVLNSGPQAPRPRSIPGVMDPNTKVFRPTDREITL